MMQRPDPMIPCKPGAEDRKAMMNRVIWMEELFYLDGRDKPDHPMRGLFTNLSQIYKNIDSTDSY
tara:strand:+ start:53 stop:247 length:195 start_codon:yes stop_codon:yes gene_type:complete